MLLYTVTLREKTKKKKILYHEKYIRFIITTTIKYSYFSISVCLWRHFFSDVIDVLFHIGLIWLCYQQCGIDNSNNGSVKFIKNLTVVESIKGKGNIKSVSGGNHHSVVLMEDGTVYAFGRADSCQLGLTPETIKRLEVRGRQEEDTGSHHNGNAQSVFKAVGVPTKIEQMEGVQDISVSSNHAIALDASGSAYSWGFGVCHALGNGSDEDEPVPYKITGQKLEGHTVYRIAAGAQHSVLLTSFS